MSQPTFFAYIAYHGGRAIDLFEGRANGSLTPVAQYGLSGMGLPLAINPGGTRLYASTFEVSDQGEVDKIDSFARDPMTGRLKKLASVRTVGRMTHISVDKSGRHVLGAGYFADLVVSHPVGAEGQATEPAFSLPTGRNAHHVLTDPDNRFAFVPNLGADQVLQLSFNAETGVLDFNAPALSQPAGAGCRHMAHHPNGRLMFLINERDGSVVSLAFDATCGMLSQLHRCSVLATPAAKAWAAQIHVTPDGKHLFASERLTNVLTRWRIDPETGAFSDKVTIEVSRNPRCFDIDPTGRFLVLAALDDDLIEVFDISDPDQAPLRLHQIQAEREPSWVEICAHPTQNEQR